MQITQVRGLGDVELREEARKASEQLFRIRFQMKLGQTEGVKRLREIRKDVARVKTILRERSLGIRGVAATAGGTAKTSKGRKKEMRAGEAS